jgi:hypothetical protein
MQEDHSREGLLPNNPLFGVESEKEYGLITYEKDGQEFSYRIITEKGNWVGFFENLADAIKGKAEIEVKAEQILEQIRILEMIERID